MFKRIVCLSVRLHFSKLSNTNQFISTGSITGLAKWIIENYIVMSLIVFLFPDSVQISRDGGSCPDTAFECQDGLTCLPGFELCNSQRSCPDGSDESEMCNGQVDLTRRTANLARSDERMHYRSSVLQSLWGGIIAYNQKKQFLNLARPTCPFRCANGNCRSIDMVCSGKDGCGDNSDEKFCHVCSKLT